MKLQCPRCGSTNAHIEKPWPHLHCMDCGLRRFVSSVEPQTSRPPRSDLTHGPSPAPGSSATARLPTISKEQRQRVGALGILIGVPAALGFVFGSRIAALILFLSLLLNVVSFLRREWKSKYLFYTALIFVFLLGGILHDVVFPPTALCADGTYSYSAHQSGTCSWHGGVARWNPGPWWKKMLGQ
jgi:DNA-directed RNA polymerase subunit RPC12/RpoP